MARIFAINDFKCDERDVENVALFVDKMNSFVNDHGEDSCNMAEEYFFRLIDIKTSSSYTKRNIDERMSYLTRLF